MRFLRVSVRDGETKTRQQTTQSSPLDPQMEGSESSLETGLVCLNFKA